jgi:hypothetical protein
VMITAASLKVKPPACINAPTAFICIADTPCHHHQPQS